jgi:hypothetical protein
MENCEIVLSNILTALNNLLTTQIEALAELKKLSDALGVPR